MNKVIVFQTWGIGDMIMSTPMLDALRQQQPQAHITIIAGSRAAADVIHGAPFCDEVRIMKLPHEMEKRKLIKEIYELRGQDFDAVLICTRISSRLAQLLRLFSGIKIIAGDSPLPRRWGYTHWYPVELNLHRIEANLNILRTIFPKAKSKAIYFHTDTNSSKEAEAFWSRFELNDRLVLGIHPGSDAKRKNTRVPLEKFVIVTSRFLNRFPAARVLIFLGTDEMDLALAFSNIDKRVILVHDLPLKIVGGLISKLQVFLSGDSGLGHLAAARQVPVITLAGPTNIGATEPWGKRNVVVKTLENISCIPCFGTKRYNHCQDLSCFRTIHEDQILEALSLFSDNL